MIKANVNIVSIWNSKLLNVGRINRKTEEKEIIKDIYGIKETQCFDILLGYNIKPETPVNVIRKYFCQPNDGRLLYLQGSLGLEMLVGYSLWLR